MKNPKDDFVAKLQEQIFNETRAIYGEEVFSRWQNPKFMGRMPNASCVGRLNGNCGDRMEIYLRIKDDNIEEARFFTDGCGSSVACGSMASELVTGKDLDQAAQIEGDSILEALGGLPEEESHCAFLAAETLMTAIHEWIVARMNAEKC
jgi:nitrogen fixation NifU-like protein